LNHRLARLRICLKVINITGYVAEWCVNNENRIKSTYFVAFSLTIYAALSLFIPVSNYNVYNYSIYVLIRINYQNWTPRILEILRSCDRPMPGPFSLTGSKMPWVRGWGSRVEMADLHATTILYIWILLKYYALGADHLMRWIFIEPNNLLIKPPNVLDIFLSFKALDLFLFCGHI
jgi:hypothetical protein